MRRLALFALILAVLVPALPASASRQERVVGGRNATRPYPFMAQMMTSAGAHRCGASLVRPQWVLTAKHCVAGRTPDSLRIMLGSPLRSQPGEVHTISQILTDPNGVSDSAVMKLSTPTTIAPIRIADAATEQSRWSPGTIATAIGWGTTSFGGPCCPDHLQEVEVPVVTDAECGRLYGPLFGFAASTEVCAGEITGGRDTCQGDSGGPILTTDSQGAWIVFGTTFYGLGCGYPGGAYGVYAEVGSNPIQAWLNSVLPPESSLSAENGSGTEGGTAAVVVRRLGTTRKNVTVDFATANGTATSGADYWGVSGTLVFEPGDRTQRILVPLLTDGSADGGETFSVQISSPTNAQITAATATVTIAD